MDLAADEMMDRKNLQIEQVLRCCRLSHDGKFIACGDWYGNIRIHDVESDQLTETQCIEAHDSEVLSLDFAKQHENGYLLVSGSRDNLITVYDSNIEYEAV